MEPLQIDRSECYTAGFGSGIANAFSQSLLELLPWKGVRAAPKPSVEM
jgi:hypothetical protein